MPTLDFNKYDKNYVILTSDRLILNSKDDSIYMMSKKTIGLSAIESIHFNVGDGNTKNENIFIVNSPNIQLGIPSEGTNEPVAKADSTVKCLNEIVNAINIFTSQVTASGATKPGILNAVSKLKLDMIKIQKVYLNAKSPIKSTISKTI
jgi:hypothetical protein